ncbi:hypothetical protein O181_088497 [Austropuccinia psidii MF-1]|uniref:Uncharacterized protein n=1 Tax=Austropuccinia psidii MF-1 TaxID=1389203 RepID=A0A9Q3P571_9BASI|nr:hypothetical protein [Austropuccinia psidii MF-1]
MSSKLTELTESSPSVPQPCVLCRSGILSLLASPWSMASSGHFDPSQADVGYKAFGVLDPALTKCLEKGKDFFQHYNSRSSKCHFCFVWKRPCRCTGPLASNIRRYLWSRKDRPFGKVFPVSEAPTPDGTPVYSTCASGKANKPQKSPYPGSVLNDDELSGKEVEVAPNSIGNQSSTSLSRPPAKIFQSHIIPRTPQTSQSTLATIPTSLPTASPSYSTSRPSLIPEVRPAPIHHSINSAILTSQQLQIVASSSRRREERSLFPFPAAQVFQQSTCWTIQVTREDPNMASENQDSVARIFRRANINNMEVIEYDKHRTIPGTASEEMAENVSWYRD